MKDEIKRKFAENLLAARMAAGLTQESLATRTGLHRGEISLLERGGREPRLTTFLLLCSALEVSPSRICAGIAELIAKPERPDEP